MKLFVAGLSYKTAPVAVRERLAVSPRLLTCHGCRLKVGARLEEVVLLSTCNRVEVYGTGPWPAGNALRIFQQLGGDADLAPHLYVKEGDEAVRHLFAVAGGLDSMVVGETEITGQVKSAYEAARAAGLTGRVTNRLFQTALQVAKEIRSHTQIGRGAVSVGSVAVELAEKIFDGDLANKTVMILGAGKMGEACVRHLSARGARSVLVANRSYERAEKLAAEFGGRALRFEECFDAMAAADIVVSSTGSPHLILRRGDVARVLPERRGRPLVLIDIAVPRDIDPDVEHLENVYLYNIDHLEAVVRENLRLREQELGKCGEIIARRAGEFMEKLAVAERHRSHGAVEAPVRWPRHAPVAARTGAVCPA
ncbi:MAG: glutamyl-tRNA reductase [Verrucomicrobiales bacterium]|nr:glutamyl-tRNA reductase [Verrucomicrobiales bacterium]